MSHIEDYSIYSSKYQNSVWGMIKFELTSCYGRIFLNKKPRLTGNSKLLHLCCGSHKFKGWINADFYQGLKFWKRYPGRPDWMLDIRYALNCEDNVWDGIFCEHAMEHLYPVQTLNLLRELYRIMKTKAWVRITVPDLKKYVDYYMGSLPHDNFLQWETGCEAIRSLTQNWFHLSVWDINLLSRFLKEAGFSNIQAVEYRQGTDPQLLMDSKDRQWETFYVEAQKA
jgi:predicted SAM-dependent methyltransferase